MMSYESLSNLYRSVRQSASYARSSTANNKPTPAPSEVAANALTAAERFEKKRKDKGRHRSNRSEKEDGDSASSSPAPAAPPQPQRPPQQPPKAAPPPSHYDFDRIDNRYLICFHCGERGHKVYPVGDCKAHLAGRPQNAAGRKVHSDYQLKMGKNTPYRPPLLPSDSSSSSSSSYLRAATSGSNSAAGVVC